MIEIAIVTPTLYLRPNPRRDTDTEPVTNLGSIWIKRTSGIRRRSIESGTPRGVRLELEAFFERYTGKTFRLRVIEPQDSVTGMAEAIVALVAAPVHKSPNSHKRFSGSRGDPFDLGFSGRLHKDFAPHWAVPFEQPSLLKSSAGDHYTYPSVTDDEDDEKKTK